MNKIDGYENQNRKEGKNGAKESESKRKKSASRHTDKDKPT